MKEKIAIWFLRGAMERGSVRNLLLAGFTKWKAKRILKENNQMLENLREKLAGKKTYIVAAAGIIGAVAAWVSGTLPPDKAIEMIWAAVMGMTMRAGVAKVGDAQ